jgi:hypothetical protein
MDATHSITDPVALVRDLDAEAIRRRLDDLDRERSALLVLLRAARAKGARQQCRKEANHA